MFSPSTYLRRRKELLGMVPQSGLIVVFGNEDSPMNYADNTYPFRQDSNFLYLAGLPDAHHFLLLDTDTGTTTLCGDDLSLDHIVWMGAQPSMAEKAAAIGAEHTATYADGLERIRQAARQQHPVHYLPPYRADRVELLAELLGRTPAQVRLGASEPLCRAIIALRAHKSDEEVAEMDLAVNITRSMHIAAMQSAAAGQTEAAVAGIVEGLAIAGGGRLSYPCIGTINGHILHNHHHHNTLAYGHLYLLDAGASSPSQYAGDITRTFPVSPNFDTRQREIYQLVLLAEEQAIAALHPGVRYLDVHLQAALTIATGLRDLGLMKGDPAEAVAAGAHALFFPHGLGHAIGLDVHDMEDLNEDWVGYDDTVQRSAQFGLRSLRLAKALDIGNTLTVEPGIYFIPALIDQWAADQLHSPFINYGAVAAYRDFGGIRIEDNVLITATGHRVLGDPIPKTIAEVEALRAAR